MKLAIVTEVRFVAIYMCIPTKPLDGWVLTAHLHVPMTRLDKGTSPEITILITSHPKFGKTGNEA